MTLQEMFDTAARGIISQGGKSADDLGFCRYRSPDGRKCAVGWLLADEAYDPDMEGKKANCSLRREWPDLFDDAGWALAVDMQVAHDESDDFAPSGEWALRVRDAADERNLSTAVLDDWESEAARG